MQATAHGSSPGKYFCASFDYDNDGRESLCRARRSASLKERNLHCVEVVRSGDAELPERRFAGRGRGRVRAPEADIRAVEGERHAVHRRGARHPRQRREAFDQSLIEARAVNLFRIPRTRQHNIERQHVRGVEAGIGVHQRDEAAHHQTRADEQHERQRDLGRRADCACGCARAPALRRCVRLLSAIR